MNRRSRTLSVVATALLVFIYAPLVVVVVYSLNAGSNLSWPPQGVSLRWFQAIFSDPAFRTTFATSSWVALWTAIIAGVIGTMAAFAITRRDSVAIRWLESSSRVPVMMPPLFVGIALVAGMKTFAIDPSIFTIIAGHVIITTPFVILIVGARLRNFDVVIEQAARDLGATPRMVLRKITAPLIAPSVLGAMLIAAAISFDEVLITNFTSGTRPTLPLFVLSRLRRTIDPSINAVATILLLIPWIAVGVAFVASRRRGAAQRQPADEIARIA